MRDPVSERLRAYYRSIQDEPPARLSFNVAHAFDRAQPAQTRWRTWRPAAGLALVGVLVIVAALLLWGVGQNVATTPSREPTPSTPASAAPSLSESPSIGPSGTTSAPTETPGETPTDGPTPTVVPTPSAVSSPSPARITLAPGLPIGSFGASFTNPVGRNDYTVTLLKDGRVLIVGGVNFGEDRPVGRLTTAQIWDPHTGKFATTGSLNEPRTDHTATLLKDGRVLIVGGADLIDGIDNQRSAELYDPSTGTFSITGSMSWGRAYHTATLLPSGKVLIAGGYGGGTLPVASAEIYDPSTGTFSPTGRMSVPRDRHTATLLPNGKVLVAGGVDEESNALASAELYDPATGRFTPTAEPMNVGRYGAAATTFSDPTHPGSSYVLIVGGRDASGQALDSAEVYVPFQDGFGATPYPMSTARGDPTTAIVVSAQYVLVIGGDPTTATADLFNPSTVNFIPLGSAGAGAGQTATLLSDCRILLSGPGGKSWELFTTVTCPA
jgi:hypothetical protein